MCKACDYTIHGAQHHFGWDNSFVPALTVAPGKTILFHCNDSSAGQLGPQSTVAACSRSSSRARRIWTHARPSPDDSTVASQPAMLTRSHTVATSEARACVDQSE